MENTQHVNTRSPNRAACMQYVRQQLFSNNAFIAKTFCVNVLSTSTAIYQQYIGNTKTSLHTLIKENKYPENDIAFDKIRSIVWE